MLLSSASLFSTPGETKDSDAMTGEAHQASKQSSWMRKERIG